MTAEECATKAMQLATVCEQIGTTKKQARAGRCGACAKYFRVKGVERPRVGPLVVDKSAD
jgi:hypothetical protein